MAKPSAEVTFRLADEPTVASADALTSRLQAGFASGSVSAKAFDHRARVARQQTALSRQRSGEGASSGTLVHFAEPDQVSPSGL
jgi:hypothetical protein